MAGFPPGLTQEEINRALAMSQGNAPRPAPVVAPSPSPDAVPPTQAPVEAAPSPDQTDEAPIVERATGSPAQAIRQYGNERRDTQNERIANIADIGDEQGLTAEDHARMQAIHERSAAQNKANVEQAKSEVRDDREHEREWQRRADDIYKQMEATKQPPPDSTMQKVLGVIGAIASMGGNAGAAHGAAMLGSMLGSDKERWALERNANSQLYQAALSGVQSDRSGQTQRLEVAQRLAALEAHEINDSLNAAKEMGLGRHANALIDEMQLKFRTQVLDELTQAERAKTAAAARIQKTNEADTLWRMPTQALIKLRDAGGLSEMGHKVLAEKIKNEAGEAGAKKTAAEALKAQNEALGSGGKKMTESERKMDVQVAGASEAFHRLVPYAFDQSGRAKNYKEGGIPGAGIAPGTQWIPDQMLPEDNVQYRTDVLANLAAVLRGESGSNIPDHEVELKAKAFGLFSSDQAVRQRALQSLLRQTKAMDVGDRLGDLREKPKPQIKFSEDAPGPNGSAGEAARAYLESRNGLGSGGT